MLEMDVRNVSLVGTTEEIATQWADINGDIIRDEIDIFTNECVQQNISQDELIKRSEEFISIADEIAPHWLKEAEIIAGKVGIDPDIYKAYIGGRYRGNIFHDEECTSFTALRKATKDGRIFFHKNRDNWDKKQSAFLMKNTDFELNKFFAVTDAQIIGCMMMVNDKGLAASADTGGTLTVRRPAYSGIMNVAMLRYLAECASSSEEGVELIKEIVSKKHYAGGANTGTHWLLVDKNSKAIEVSCNSDEVDVRLIDEDIYFSARRGDTAHKKLIENSGKIDFPMFNAVSRDESVCFKTSISGMSVEISPDDPDTLTTCWTAFPANSISIPVFIGANEVPRPLVDGKIYTLGKKINKTNFPEEYKSKRTNQLYEEMEDASKKLDISNMTKWTRKVTAETMEILKNL